MVASKVLGSLVQREKHCSPITLSGELIYTHSAKIKSSQKKESRGQSLTGQIYVTSVMSLLVTSVQSVFL